MPNHESSSSTSSTEGAAFPWILEHLLAYPGTYEIPLRTMYTLNSAPSAQQYPRQSTQSNQSIQPGTPSLSSTASSPDSSPASPTFPSEQQYPSAAHNATEHFKSCLMTHISKLPTQPFSLPPSFITSFVRRCFTTDLCLVDFTQALTALDYLKDLDSRRKRELALALQRLGLEQSTDDQIKGDCSKNPKVLEWVESVRDKERKVEALYTQVYIGLRRWTLINEMRLEPFSKANCIAMLNTLYPPTTAIPPTRQLTSHILESQRNAFFRYIQAVERNGKGVLKNLENQGQRKEDVNGWTVVREIVDKYLRTSNGVIEECLEVTGPDYFDQDAEAHRRADRRADSGVSFATGDRPSTSGSSSGKSNLSAIDKPLPASPQRSAPPSRPPPCVPTTPKKRGTTLEKIARELRNLRSRNDVKEIPRNVATPEPDNKEPKGRSLRKMKSTSSIGGSKSKHARLNSDDATTDFHIDDARRQRLIWEAQREKENRAPQKLGHTEKQGSFDAKS
ncbi:hypothetical protein ACLMJK_000311 [Lecanora helva]